MTLVRDLVTKSHLSQKVFSVIHSSKKKFECPICGYFGPFRDVKPETGLRRHAMCANCGSMVRHRLQYIALEKLAEQIDLSTLSCIHFAPEAFFTKLFREKFGSYETADLNMRDVDHKVDLSNLPFPNESYDFVYASHVLEHIRDDRDALSEIRRILRPGGIAILPVPIFGAVTVEYPEANPHEADHVRAPGFDYIDRYEDYFKQVDCVRSSDVPERFQVYIYEDRSFYPTDTMPFRPAMDGEKHEDVVPICYR